MEASGSMGELWPKWQGQVIHGVGRLGGCLGCSDHSAVFLTEYEARRPSIVAVKLVPADRAPTELLLPRWKRAASLAHGHLIRIWDWGGCQLDGLSHLYCVLEYAEQTLAQVLLRRALTSTEAREMLLPTLDALAFLHGENLVHGQLNPANILVVGEQLKLASDTIRRVREGPVSPHRPTRYDPPEVRQETSSPAGDIWALGVTLFEALTRRPLSELGEPGKAIALPADFPPGFRDVVARCLSQSSAERPSVAELMAWTCGNSSDSAPARIPPAGPVPLERSSVDLAASRLAPTPGIQSEKPRALVIVSLAAIVIVALAWTAVHVFGTAGTKAASLSTPAPPVRASAESMVHAPSATAPAAAQLQSPLPTASTTTAGRDNAGTSPAVLHEVIPDVSRSARQTIRGHIKVWVRIVIDQNGAVVATTADRTGPSKYFLRRAVEAAKQWQFSATVSPSPRLMQIRFDFSRDGTTEQAVAVP